MNQIGIVISGLLTKAYGLHQKRLYQDARGLYQSVLQIDPRQADALHLLGVLESDTGRDALAVDYITRSLAANPRFAPAHVSLGLALKQLKRFDEALQSYDRALVLHPDFAVAHFNRGNLLRDIGRLEEAFESFQQAARLMPEDADCQNNCGAMLWRSNRKDEALAFFDRALALDADHAEAMLNRARALEDLRRVDEALAIYDVLLARNPANIDARVNRGSILDDRGQTEAALAEFLRAQQDAPDDVGANWNESLCRLKLGDYLQGWAKYEWRWAGPQKQPLRSFTSPRWQGESLQGRSILLYAEQGLGDTLQFCRFASCVAEQGARVILEVQPVLVRLLQSLGGVAEVIARGDPLPEVDFHCALMSLPGLLKTTLASIPAQVPYLQSDAESLACWRQRLGERQRPRVALVWGSSTHTRDQYKRVLGVEQLAPLFALDADFFMAQKELSEPEQAFLRQSARVQMFPGELNDFSTTAALLSFMDVVISIDTSVAHLAGALGKTLWVLLPHAAEWRWLESRSDSPWYPTARLFRQSVPGDWSEPVQSMVELLGTRLV